MIVTDDVRHYIEGVHTDSDQLLAEMEAHGERDRIPIVVPTTGAFLQILVRAHAARRALEVGTAIGVSTLYIARGLASGGAIVSFEIDPERHQAARGYLERAGLDVELDLRLQDAREGLSTLAPGFDFAFLDGVKAQYSDYFERVLPLLTPGAVLAVDNVLMGGSVADPADTSDRARTARAFNQRLLNHPELTGTVTPVGDGVLVAVKR
jgi:predicted O-methyltransferase YrrM